ncbi:DUF1236 domain-containing protein [Salinarimonas ramus]|uniref:SH3b domain-containing protein n=1 Tax=Salinarimonas ramus TaxID=690164 RepID=A0A917Q5Z1_9HYPH|nr:DUF1236 domain-containing protein [Salinarimonas ramus]GGK27738.1 hypothetical protein GCM10011322_12860 [Salinarimonas ramus]
MPRHLMLLAGAAALGFAGTFANPAAAQVAATATTDLNMRAGPGPNYEIVDTIVGNDTVTVVGCLPSSAWCRVQYQGTEAWAYGDYLTAQVESAPVIVTQRREIVPEAQWDPVTATGAVAGEIVGSIIGGTVGAVTGAIGGAVDGFTAPPPPVRTYVYENRVEPVYLEGEVVAGAGLPPAVGLRPIPDYEYEYAYVNGQPVLVDPATRRIVYIVR